MGQNVYNIYLTFPSDVKTADDKADIPKSIIRGETRGNFDEVLTTSESAIKYLFQQKRNEDGENDFSLDRVFLMVSNMVKGKVGFIPAITEKYNNFNEYTTHLDVLKHQMDKFYQEYFDEPITPKFSSDKILEEIDCGDDLDNTDQIGENIIKLCRRIVKYKETLQKEVQKDIKIKLYIDTTGGLRNAAMIFLIIGRIMSYLDIEVADVLYTSRSRGGSDKFGECTVNSIKDIYDLLDLISGFEEFLMFGSAKKLNDYYKPVDLSSQPSLSKDSLDDVLKGMEQFADAINISRRGDFENALRQLSQCLSKIDSEELTGSSFNHSLIRLLGEPIKKTYTPLVNESKDALSYVEWCLERDYIQQALTLFKECVPQFLVDNGIVIVDEEEFKLYLKKKDVDRDLRIIRRALNMWNKSQKPKILESESIGIDGLINWVKTEKLTSIKPDKSRNIYSTIDYVFNEISQQLISKFEGYINRRKNKLYSKLHHFVNKYIVDICELLSTIDEGNFDLEIRNKHIEEFFVRKNKELEDSLLHEIISCGFIPKLEKTSSIYQVISLTTEITKDPNSIQNINTLDSLIKEEFFNKNKAGFNRYNSNVVQLREVLETFDVRFLQSVFYNFLKSQIKYKSLFEDCFNVPDMFRYDFKKGLIEASGELYNMVPNVPGVTIVKQQKVSMPLVLKMLCYYFEIKKSRNDSNHARLEGSSQFKTANDIKEAMMECISLIRSLTKSV